MEPYCLIKHDEGEFTLPMRWQDGLTFGRPQDGCTSVRDASWHGRWLVAGPDADVNEKINQTLHPRGRVDIDGKPCVWKLVGNVHVK